MATTHVNPMQAKYEQALERAQADHLVIFHADPAVGEWFVQNPSHDGFYTVRQETPKSPFTCNCPATDYCKHRAFVRCHVVNGWKLPRLYGRKLAEALAMAARGMSLAPATTPDPEPPTPTAPVAPAAQPTIEGWDTATMHYTCRDCGYVYGADEVILADRNLLNPHILCGSCAYARHQAEQDAKAAKRAARKGNAQPVQHDDPVDLSDVPATPAPVQPVQPAQPRSLPSDGTYTIVHADGSHRTLKVHTPREGGLAGKHIVKYLCGQDNDSDYAGFAFISDTGYINLWKRFAGNEALAADANVLVSPEQAQAAGLAYALNSGNCYRCGRTLTVPASIHRGLGPDCAAKVFA